MYSSAAVYFIALSLALGSSWGLIPSALTILGLVWRRFDEEKFLANNLPGYKEYCAKVRWHLTNPLRSDDTNARYGVASGPTAAGSALMLPRSVIASERPSPSARERVQVKLVEEGMMTVSSGQRDSVPGLLNSRRNPKWPAEFRQLELNSRSLGPESTYGSHSIIPGHDPPGRLDLPRSGLTDRPRPDEVPPYASL
jgi:hypothetical protein